MHILILCITKPKSGSYADKMLHLVLSFFTGKGYDVVKAGSISEAKKLSPGSDNCITIIEKHNSFLPFFSNIQVQYLLKKRKIDWMIQVVDNHIASTQIPQLIFPLHPDRLELKSSAFTNVVIAAPSRVAQQKIKSLVSPAPRVEVISFFAGECYRPISWSDKQTVKMNHTQGREYFFAPAKHKTQAALMSLLKAFSAFKKWQQSNMKLVLAGAVHFLKEDDWNEKISTYKFRDDVVFAGDVAEADYACLLASAYAFINTDVQHENVLPVVQAMQCETPVISFASDTVNEYAGDGAAVVIDADNYDQLGEKMILLYKDEALRNGLVAAGAARAKMFSKQASEQQLAALAPGVEKETKI